MNYDEWIRLGERLGLKGGDLAAFVKEKEADLLAREERTQRREEERRILEMQHELQIKEKELEVERIKSTRPAAEGSSRVLRPKLPRYDEVCDDMDAYIERFERYAVSQGWEEETWAMSLSSLLTGKGLEVYTSMSPEEACDYTALKTAVLKRYQLTEEGFRTKLRSSRPEAGESVHQYLSRLRRYFSRWTEMAQEEQSYQSLCDLMIREQFIQSCSSDLAMFLKERAPKTMTDMSQLAEQYVEAHGGRLESSKQSSSSAPKGEDTERRSDKMSPPNEKKIPGREAKTCFICKKPGHLARDCRFKLPNRESPWQKNEKRISAACTLAEQKEGPVKDNTRNGQLRLENGEVLPIFSCGCTIETMEGTRNLDLRRGFVGDKEVKVLRDTGCESAAVRRDFVRPEQYLEKEIVMITIDGQAKVVPLAKIDVDTPYFEGEIEVMVPKTLICDLIIGNIPGVRDVTDPEWTSIRDKSEATAAVMTRAQTQKAEGPMKALQVPEPSCDKEVNVDNLKKAQKEDKALEKLWSIAVAEERLKTASGAEYRYEVQKDVLYRIFKKTNGPSDREIKQVVVPVPYRRRVMELAHESIVGGHLSSQKTSDRVMTSFYWPGICSDVTRFCRSCDICQRTIPKGRVRRVPLGKTTIIDEPFHRVAVDLIGPIILASESGNRYILTIVDYATRYPEAIALSRIDTERVAEVMLVVFSRVGFPSEVLSARGSQFTSDLMDRVSRLISKKQLFTTPYNPQCNGLCERINGVLKDMQSTDEETQKAMTKENAEINLA
ncbi:uncharacterized protein LOC123538510 [Mercenaria mercenaria]|uniref:uncharacterized protein LOC123538510 n=1 Tax=Mercenaria mercenaria TaxID=6596 RepID=UPI00234E8065|nr:uncharacterized protein LOC123538510 [Mercenaria mercenaria]